MKRIMLDTNIVSHVIKGHPHVTRQMVNAPIPALCISSITHGELLYGLAKRPEAKRLHNVVNELLKRLDVLPWDTAVAQHYGKMRTTLEQQGKPLAPLDLLIAAHAVAVGAVLITNDNAFHHVDGLLLEDWTK